MRLSKLFSTTLREAPSEVEVTSHQLLLRAGFIRQLGTGIFSYLPLARRAMTKIETIMREEINAIGGQEVTMPVVHPAEVWQESGRWYQIGSEMGRFKDKSNHDMVLAMTHEEVVSALVRSEIHSHRQLPALVYHIQTKWRDDPRPRAGLIRVREFTMLDSYSLDASWDGLDAQYRAHYQAYFNIFNRCGLPVVAVRSDTGMMGGKLAHEYMYLTPIGEDSLLFCDTCGYAANRQVARFSKPTPATEEAMPLQKVATPGITSIEDLARFLDIPPARTAKAVFMMVTFALDELKTTRFVFSMVRGDMEVNEAKLSNALAAARLGQVLEIRPATEDETHAIGVIPGYASPIGFARGKPGQALVVVDDLIPHSPNLVAGANESGYHLLHTNYGRDYTADLTADLASAAPGAGCPQCGAPLRLSRGVEVGNIFKLGTRYSEAFGCTFLDEHRQLQPVIMGSYGIGVGRLLACIAEQHHDEYGLICPISVAPYPIHLVLLAGKGSDTIRNTADQLYLALCQADLEPLYDDRTESPGVKFNDADLIGLPLRITVSERALQAGGVEFKRRDQPEKTIVPVETALGYAQSELKSLYEILHKQIIPVAYQD